MLLARKSRQKRPSQITQRGYKSVRERVEKYPRIFRSCTNCDYYYQAVGDKEEVCQNNVVLEYDMVVEDNRIYCLHWKQFIGHKSEVKENAKSNSNRVRIKRAGRIFKSQQS